MASLLETRRFYPDATRCTGLTWQALVDQLMGVNPAITRTTGRMVINIGIGMVQYIVLIFPCHCVTPYQIQGITQYSI